MRSILSTFVRLLRGFSFPFYPFSFPLFRASLLLLAAALSVTAGCSHKRGGIAALSPEDSLREPFRTIHVEPSALREVRKVVLAPIQIAPNAGMAEKLSEQYQRKFAELALGRLGVETVSSQSATKFLRSKKKLSGASGQDVRMLLMRHFKADSVLALTINEFSFRDGSAVGAFKPAAVSVQYDLFQKAKEPVWISQFFFRDQALTDDILAVRKRFTDETGAGWRDASELLETSMEQALQALEEDREESFIRIS